jgi:AraC-like DNA-binding protein
MSELQFTVPEILSLIGVTQCLYIIVYIVLRAGRHSRAGLPLIYFFVLGLAFFYDFAEGTIGRNWDYYYYFQWAAWFLGPPLSVPLIFQIAHTNQNVPLKYYSVLLLPVAAFASSLWIVFLSGAPECARLLPCEDMKKWLTLTGFISGAISLLILWAEKNILNFSSDRRTGKDRYWLTLSFVTVNIFFLLAMVLSLGTMDHVQAVVIRTIMGLSFVYLVGTSLLRIYPQAVILEKQADTGQLTADEMQIVKKIENLLNAQKVYHEAVYSRGDMARECEVSEAVISKLINAHFGKSFPQIISEYRVNDAKRMLVQTDANIKTIAEEVGFNSLASFNRVFREVAGETPSEYRKKTAK